MLPRKKRPRRTLEQKTSQELIREADKWFSKYVRLRDAWYEDGAWVGECITCPRKLIVMDANERWNAGANLGHYITRGHRGLRYDEFNCNLQCAHCNAWRDKVSMIEAYKEALDFKYGKGVAARLKRESHLITKLTKPDLLQIISDCKEYIRHALTYPENYAK